MKQSELVGTWRITSDSRKYLPVDQQNLDVYVTLRADGNFVSSALPEIYTEDPQAPDRELFSKMKALNTQPGSGTWALVKRDGTQLVELSFATDVGAPLDISNTFSPTIYYWKDDVDSGKRIDFHKQK